MGNDMFGGGRFTFKDQKVAGETENWTVKESETVDVNADDAHATGNLIVKHKTGGTVREFEAP